MPWPKFKMWPWPASSADDVQRGLANFLLWAAQNGGIEIALDRDMRTRKGAQFAEGNAPIDAEYLRTGLDDRRQKMVRGFGVVDDRDDVAKAGDDFLDDGQHEFGVVVEIQFAAPSVKKLYGRDASSDLALQVKDRGLGDAVEEFAEDCWSGCRESSLPWRSLLWCGLRPYSRQESTGKRRNRGPGRPGLRI